MSEAPPPIAILIVDDHALFRESLARLLAREADFDVVGQCGSVDDGLRCVRQRRADIILLDFDLGLADGLDFMRQAGSRGVEAKVLIVTAGLKPEEAARLMRERVSGVFLKRDSASSLAQTIRDVMAGKVSFDQELFQRAIEAPAPFHAAGEGERFTKRERDVLLHVFEGLANKEIASRLGVSESSVKATLQQLFAKTGVRTRSQLVRIALERYKHDL